MTALLLTALPIAAKSAEPTTFVMGTSNEETSLVGKWYRRIFHEAFRRLDVPLTVVTVPNARLTAMADSGELHGQTSRLEIYAADHPNQLRVLEALDEQRLSLFGHASMAGSGYPTRLEDLATGKWQVDYRRGILVCEKTLKPLVPADMLSDIGSTAQGMNKLRSGRANLFCDIAINLESELLKPEFRGDTGFRPILDLGQAVQIYPYVHRSRTELVPRLAETLKKMKSEGLIKQYYSEVRRELEMAR